MNVANKKGRRLENAVLAIERAVLQASPSYSDKAFQIEGRKIVAVAGVRHELDIWVKVDLGPGYDTVFVFECKNWEKKVGKNEIIGFAEKVKAVNAQRGFFTAKGFTRDAIAQAALDPRVELLEVNEETFKNLQYPTWFHALNIEDQKGELFARARGVEGNGTMHHFDLAAATVLLVGQPLNLQEYVQEWMSATCVRRTETFSSEAEGAYALQGNDERLFDPGHLIVNGHDIEKLSLDVQFTAKVTRPPILSRTEVRGRGRMWRLAPVTIPGGTIEISHVTTDNETTQSGAMLNRNSRVVWRRDVL